MSSVISREYIRGSERRMTYLSHYKFSSRCCASYYLFSFIISLPGVFVAVSVVCLSGVKVAEDKVSPSHCLGRHALLPIVWAAMHSSLLPGLPCTPPHCLGCHALLPTVWSAMHSSLLSGPPCTPPYCLGCHALLPIVWVAMLQH